MEKTKLNKVFFFILAGAIGACGTEAEVDQRVYDEAPQIGARSFASLSQETNTVKLAAENPESQGDNAAGSREPFADVPEDLLADSVQTFKNQGDGRCIDDTPSGGLRTWPCNGTNPQKWYVHVWGDGSRRLKSYFTAWCIDDSTSHGLRAIGCHGSTDPDIAHQKWIVKKWADGTIRFQNQATRRCMEDHGGPLVPASCNDGQLQSWY